VLICGVTEEVGEILASSDFASHAEVEPVFKASDILFESTSQALRRAREIIAEEEASECYVIFLLTSPTFRA